MPNKYLRYQRQLNLIGYGGQNKFTQKRILCVGAGGLGTLVSSYLVAAGVGSITLADGDNIELSNLTRQITYTESDCGTSKVKALGSFLAKLNSNTNINLYQGFIDHTSLNLINQHDLVLDCSDSFKTRYLLSDSCVNGAIPLISASIDGFMGQVMAFTPGVCYRCIFPNNEVQLATCYNGDVVDPAVAIVAGIQANEAFKLIAGIDLNSRLIQINCLDNQFINFKLTSDLECINQHQEPQVTNIKLQYLSPSEITKLQQKEQVIILNLSNHQPKRKSKGVIFLNLDNLTNITQSMALDQTIIVVCDYGFKSKIAAVRLLELGYTNIYYSSI